MDQQKGKEKGGKNSGRIFQLRLALTGGDWHQLRTTTERIIKRRGIGKGDTAEEKGKRKQKWRT